MSQFVLTNIAFHYFNCKASIKLYSGLNGPLWISPETLHYLKVVSIKTKAHIPKNGLENQHLVYNPFVILLPLLI